MSSFLVQSFLDFLIFQAFMSCFIKQHPHAVIHAA